MVQLNNEYISLCDLWWSLEASHFHINNHFFHINKCSWVWGNFSKCYHIWPMDQLYVALSLFNLKFESCFNQTNLKKNFIQGISKCNLISFKAAGEYRCRSKQNLFWKLFWMLMWVSILNSFDYIHLEHHFFTCRPQGLSWK